MQTLVKSEKKSSIDISQVHRLLSAELQSLDALILKELHSEVPLVNEITEHIVKSGGKRLRPIIALLVAKMLDYCGEQEHLELAAIIEFVHTATLLHDDVVDRSELRRNQPTANAIWGNEASVLSGDFLYSRAFQLLARRSNIPVMKVMANATNLICEGEVIQLTNIGKTDLSEADYFKVIERKTAQLYSAASEIGAILATDDEHTRAVAKQFGLHLGLSFQLIDDLLDYTADSAVSGKNLGDDLAEGKVTLPLIYTMEHGTERQKRILFKAITQKGINDMSEVIQAITASKGCEYTFNCAQREAERAKACLQQLPQNKYHDALAELCDFVLLREF